MSRFLEKLRTDRRTDGQTDRQTDRQTIWSIVYRKNVYFFKRDDRQTYRQTDKIFGQLCIEIKATLRVAIK